MLVLAVIIVLFIMTADRLAACTLEEEEAEEEAEYNIYLQIENALRNNTKWIKPIE